MQIVTVRPFVHLLNDFSLRSSQTLRRHLLRGVRSVRILAYSGRVAVLGANAEAVLVSPKLGSSGVVMTASVVGRGRFVLLANDQMFYRVTQQTRYRALWLNMVRWLAAVKDVSRAQLAYANHPLPSRPPAHAILFWNGKWEIPRGRVDRILQLLKEGRISVLFALRPWLLPGRVEDRSFAPLLQAAGVWLLKGVSTWHGEEWPTRQRPKSVVPIERLLQSMKLSFGEFLSGAKSLYNILSKLPTQLQVNHLHIPEMEL